MALRVHSLFVIQNGGREKLCFDNIEKMYLYTIQMSKHFLNSYGNLFAACVSSSINKKKNTFKNAIHEMSYMRVLYYALRLALSQRHLL